jgi:hypothetical protein
VDVFHTFLFPDYISHVFFNFPHTITRSITTSLAPLETDEVLCDAWDTRRHLSPLQGQQVI